MTPIADHFDMPDQEQAGDRAEARGIGGMPTCSYPPGVSPISEPLSVESDRNRQLIYILQELEGCRQQLAGLGYPSIASIVNEAVMATMGAWYETRPGT